MIEELRKYISNRSRQGSKCTKVLGSTSKVYSFADFWEMHGDDLEIITAKILHDWTSEEVFNHEELKAFKQGLAKMSTFFIDCAKEAKSIDYASRLNNTSSSSK